MEATTRLSESSRWHIRCPRPYMLTFVGHAQGIRSGHNSRDNAPHVPSVRQEPPDSMSGCPVLERGHIMAPAVRVWLPNVSGHKVILGRDMWE